MKRSETSTFPAGSRMTVQRRAILEQLAGMDSHPTAEELHRELRRHLPHISLGTVYRNLDLLCRAGAVSRLDGNGSQVRYDGRQEPHLHIRCEGCGRVDDIPVPELPALQRSVAGRTDYEVRGYSIMFEGLCPRCRRKQENRKDRR